VLERIQPLRSSLPAGPERELLLKSKGFAAYVEVQEGQKKKVL
jgi:hypothetical protein